MNKASVKEARSRLTRKEAQATAAIRSVKEDNFMYVVRRSYYRGPPIYQAVSYDQLRQVGFDCPSILKAITVVDKYFEGEKESL